MNKRFLAFNKAERLDRITQQLIKSDCLLDDIQAIVEEENGGDLFT